MSALDLFAMLNAPVPGSGAGASGSGQSGGQADGAFAGLLAIMAPKGEATGEAAAASTAASAGMSLTPFRFNGANTFVASDEAAANSDEGEQSGEGSEAGAGDDGGPAPAGLITGIPTPPPPPQTLAAQPAGAASAPAPASPPVSPEAEPTASPALSAEGDPQSVSDQPPAAASARAETGSGFQISAPQGAQTVQPTQASPAPQSASGAAPPTPDGAPEGTAEAARATVVTDARAATEAARTAGQQAATVAVAPEAGRLAQPPRPDPVQAERRGERREGDSRINLFSAAESADAPRPSVAAPAPTNTAVTTTPAPGPGTAPVEARAEIAPITVEPATPDGEAAPEPTRTVDAQSAASVREHLPSTLSRASAETTAMLSAQIVRRLEARSTRFDMVLTPEDLGRVDVRMEVDSDGQLTARLAFDNPAAAAELRGRADELRRQLEAAGFQMAEGSLEFAERDGGRRDQPFDQRGRAFNGAGQLVDAADTLSAPPRWTALSLTPEGVDMKV
ncbi:MAG: flagellar hook-length control protein FliK [Brevundimonas sp.]|jgi:flagellar hook-length control protein FliK|uniref:flagellar hook-length control protein FliK n=1 Tax=Brevundimonas sp. TaxID=1871086 RepID=UPI0039E3004A